MSTKPLPVYLHTIADVPGVVAANNFLTAFNPVTSTRAMIGLAGVIASYSAGTTTTLVSLQTYRINAAPTGGTLIAASNIARFDTTHPDPATVIRINNPSATPVGGILSAFPPVISTGTGASNSIATPPSGASFICRPGEGVVFRTSAGDTDQIWNISFIWGEL